MLVVNDDHRCLTFLLVTTIYHLVLFLVLVPMRVNRTTVVTILCLNDWWVAHLQVLVRFTGLTTDAQRIGTAL